MLTLFRTDNYEHPMEEEEAMTTISIPRSERERFLNIVAGEASRYRMDVREYVRKVWYHQQAARLGEYVALMLVDLLLTMIPESQGEH